MEATRVADGAVVVYFDPEPTGPDSFQRAVATGPEIIDPQTKLWWAPVMLSDRVMDLLPSTLIVDVVPGG